MATFIGVLIGGLIAVYVLAMLWEFAVFKRVLDDPLAGKLTSVVVAWLSAGIMGGYGFANGGPFYWTAFGLYAFPAIILGAFAYRRGMHLRDQASADDRDMAETFQ